MSKDKKKHYHMGSSQLSDEQKKQMGSAVEGRMDEFKTILEQQANTKAQELDINKLIAEFPYRPNGDRAIVLPHSNEKKLPSGIIIPDTVADKPQAGVIIAIGEETEIQHKILEHMVAIRSIIDVGFEEELEPDFNKHKVGDTVLFGKMAGGEIEVSGVKYIALRIAELWATIK